MTDRINRIGEENVSNFSSKMIITRYKTNKDIDVYFSEYNWTAKNKQYNDFKNGKIKCPYEPRVYGHGYLGEGKYKMSENGKNTKCYEVWCKMLQRCYDEKLHEKYSTYTNCDVCKEWLCFQNFAEWYYKNYYEVGNEKMCLDKDILHKGNKIYSPENCIFVPEKINKLFPKRDNLRGKYPIGVCYNKQYGKFKAQCSVYDYEENKSKIKHLGYYETPQKAFEVYKEFKEQNIKEVADYYKNQIPDKLYNAMYNYKVDIDD
jgi:hypothetical protein